MSEIQVQQLALYRLQILLETDGCRIDDKMQEIFSYSRGCVDLLVVDRYEQYPMLDDELKELVQEGIVLVDMKTEPFPDICTVEYKTNGDLLVY